MRTVDNRAKYRVILLTGIEQENTRVRVNYTGPRFWQNDRLGYSSNGLRFQSALVSGSGDGALQDYLRLTCGNRPAREIYETYLQPGESEQPSGTVSAARAGAERLLREISRTVNTIRDLIARREPFSQMSDAVGSVPGQVRASLVAIMEESAFEFASWWGVPPVLLEPWSVLSDDDLFPVEDVTRQLDETETDELRKCVHTEFDKIIRSLVNDPSAWQAICQTIRESQLISEAVLYPIEGRRVALVNRSESFSICYPMNHCLSLLIGVYIERELHTPTLFHELELTRVTPAEESDHICHGSADNCAGEVHRAAFNSRSGEAGDEHALENDRYDPVVIPMA